MTANNPDQLWCVVWIQGDPDSVEVYLEDELNDGDEEIAALYAREMHSAEWIDDGSFVVCVQRIYSDSETNAIDLIDDAKAKNYTVVVESVLQVDVFTDAPSWAHGASQEDALEAAIIHGWGKVFGSEDGDLSIDVRRVPRSTKWSARLMSGKHGQIDPPHDDPAQIEERTITDAIVCLGHSVLEAFKACASSECKCTLEEFIEARKAIKLFADPSGIADETEDGGTR